MRQHCFKKKVISSSNLLLRFQNIEKIIYNHSMMCVNFVIYRRSAWKQNITLIHNALPNNSMVHCLNQWRMSC